MSYLEKVDVLMARADLVGAWRVLDAHQAQQSGDPQALIAVSRLLRLQGRHTEACEVLGRAIEIDPANPQALSERGRLALDAGDLAGADTWYARAYCEGTEAESWVVDWLDLLLRLGSIDVARRVAHAYCSRVPGRPEGWFQLGLAHQRARHHLQALSAYHEAARLDPRMPMLRNNTAAAYIELLEYDLAQSLLEQTLADEPGNAMAWTNLASLLLRRGDPRAGRIAAERACTLAPDYPVALQVYSHALKELQQWDAALDLACRALDGDPGSATFVWSVAILQLLRGDFQNGWRNHEARWRGSPELRDVSPNVPAPLWQGEPLEGRTLFVWGEQGHGDAMQFMRFVPLIAERVRREGGKLVYCCFSNLLPLFERSLAGVVETIVAHDQRPLPDFDVHLPLCSLPLMLGTRVEDLPVRSSYLTADAAKIDAWRGRGQSPGRLRVGLVWSGSRTHQRNPYRSLDPLAFARTFGAFHEIEFFSLQVNAADEVSAASEAGLRLTDVTAELQSFDDTAALIQSLDLVITVCTSVAHLAGALGVPAWVLLDVNPHWVWMTDRQDSPWYPSVRLYRQESFRQWEPVLARVAADLTRLAAPWG
ncbi:tetratricopeptide repeat protein [Burkholderia sp. R-70211]|nr:tetratricopeptide repeat protein [Burkholderia sp. R-70211]